MADNICMCTAAPVTPPKVQIKYYKPMNNQNMQLKLSCSLVFNSLITKCNLFHLMLYKAKITICYKIQTKHTNALCRQNTELLNVKSAVMQSKH